MADPEGTPQVDKAKPSDYTASRLQHEYSCPDGQHDYVYQSREQRMFPPYRVDVYYCRRCVDRQERAT